MKFTDAASITGMRLTADGYLVGDVRCARTGCQTYHSAEIGLGDQGMVTVYRPDDAVFARDSMATFAGKPVTIGHPAEPVTADNWKTHAVGDIGEDIARDGEFVRVPIKLMDAAAIKAVQDGTREISMGYTTPIEARDGIAPDGTAYQAVQTGPIRINHLAIVSKARGGAELRVGDGVNQWGATPITMRKSKEVTMTDILKTVVLGDQAAQVAADSVSIIDKFKADAAKKLADALASKDAAIAEKEEEIGKLKADLSEAEKKVPTADALDALVAERADLMADAEKLAGIKDAKGTPADIRKAIVAKRLGDAAVEGVSDAEITGMFKAVKAQGVKDGDPFKRTVADGVKTQVSDADTEYNAMLADMQNAWKTPSKKEAN